MSKIIHQQCSENDYFPTFARDLVDKFPGGILGSVLGDILANNFQTQIHSNSLSDSIKLSSWTQMSLESLNLLSKDNLGKIDWFAAYSSFLPAKFNGEIGCSELAVASLPIVLFFHDQPNVLREYLSEIATLSQEPNCFAKLWIWSYGISLVLQGNIEIKELISMLLSLKEAEKTSLGKQLETIQKLLCEQASLKQVEGKLGAKEEFNSLAMAQALYCFLSTPEQFYLSVSRSMQMKSQPQLTATLTGAIAGIYNSWFGIPIDWRLNPQLSKVNAEYQVSKQVEQVVNNWLGVY